MVKSILNEACATKNVVESANKEGLYKNLEEQQSQLEICEKALADYMESKRRAFPRFYFVSTADLLDILSNGNNPVKVMTHMNKCFQAIEKLTLDTNNPPAGKRPKAKEIISCVGKETIPFKSDMELAGKVEEYMNLIIDKMRSELKMHCFDSMQAYGNPKPRHEWCFDWSSQLGLVVNQIYWCSEVEAAFDKISEGDAGAMKKYSEQQMQQITDLIASTRRNLEKPQRQKVMNMITIDAHSRDMVIGLIEQGETSKKCFKWMSQLRTYWDSDIDDSVIRLRCLVPLRLRVSRQRRSPRHHAPHRSCVHHRHAGVLAVHGHCSCRSCWNWQDGDLEGSLCSAWQVDVRFQLCARDGLPHDGRYLQGSRCLWFVGLFRRV